MALVHPLGEESSPTAGCPTVLIVGPAEQRPVLSTMLAASGWKVCEGDCVLEAVLTVIGSSVSVIVTAPDLPDGSWRDVLEIVPLMGRSPRIVVSAPFADERLWAEVLNLGGYDLTESFDLLEVARTVESAYRDWMMGEMAA